MKIGIVGMGLIGASLGRAIVKYTDFEVLGADTNPEVLKRADDLFAHTRALEDEDYGKLDVVIFALFPTAAIAEMDRICPRLKEGAIIADTCGNKRVIEKEMLALKEKYPHLRFVGTHPMAGREYAGIENSSAELFRDAWAILVPTGDDEAVNVIKELYINIGVKGVEVCSAQRHDEMIAYTSQLAHVVSSCYVQNPLSKSHAGFSAGSFADLTRVARLNPDMWTELFLQNRDNLAQCVDNMIERLTQFANALSDADGDRLKIILSYGTSCKERADSAQRERQ